MKLTKKLPFWLRALLYTLSYLAIWANFSLPHLIENRPVEFQAAGTLIIAWAIFFLGRHRLQYEQATHSAETHALIASLNRLEAHRTINEERLNLTFDLHMLQLSELSKKVGIPNPFGPTTAAEISDHALSIQKRMNGKVEIEAPEEDRIVAEAIKSLKANKKEIVPWTKLTWKIELFFLVAGTLQSGYGSFWVTIIHSHLK